VFVFFLLHMRAIQLLGGTLGILLTLTLASSLPAESLKTCASAESRQARREAGRLEDWESVYRSFKRFGACDQGKVAEEYSYVISRLLAHHWGQVDVLLGLAAEDLEFKQFVLRHIDENIPEEEAQLIVNHSRQHCPSEGKWLCEAIVDY
jgi:esterase/lipase